MYDHKIIPFQEVTLSHNFMFGEVMRHAEVCVPFLEALLQKPIARVQYITKEADLSDSLIGHGIRLDVYLNDEAGTRYNIEMQRTDTPALEKRVRYYQSGIDRDILAKGIDYEELSHSFVIFICNFDYFGKGLAQYEKVSIIKDCPELSYEDGSHAYILNTHYTTPNASDEILSFLQFVRTDDKSLAQNSSLVATAAHWVDTVRHDKSKEVAYMTYEMSLKDAQREARMEGRAEGRKEGEVFGQQKLLRRMLASMSILDISKATGLSKEEIEHIVKS